MLADGLGDVLPVQIHPLLSILPMAHGDIHLAQDLLHRLGVAGVHASALDRQSHRAINGPGVHIEISHLLGQSPGQGGFPRPRRAVDGYAVILHCAAPSFFSKYSVTAWPATQPVAQAICRLNPPV